VPADHGLGLDDEEDVLPARPGITERRPEKSIQRVQQWARAFSLKHGDLVPQGKNFKGCIASALEEDADNREHGQNEFRHEFNLVTRCN